MCNLASIAVNQFVNASSKTYDFARLREVTKVVTRNLNKIIDVNFYPVPEARKSNMRHRPIGIGIQGLADAFILMRYPFESEEAQLLNKQIFETIYYGALEASCELAEKFGPYETYEGCPVSKGILQVQKRWPLVILQGCPQILNPFLVRHVECDSHFAARLGLLEGQNQGTWSSQFLADGAHAHGVDRPNPGQ